MCIKQKMEFFKKTKNMKNNIDFIDGKCYYKGKEVKLK